ncbi:ATP-dependent sacrificial sulfur transferase LarE [Streptosporangium sp. KLBMP 9127]|nr:ATP-dependent sacrificial sulfur transferase LarE [Streptosporangium sp. KLBMP 9127]
MAESAGTTTETQPTVTPPDGTATAGIAPIDTAEVTPLDATVTGRTPSRGAAISRPVRGTSSGLAGNEGDVPAAGGPEDRLAGLMERLAGLGTVAVAFSGGADSAFVLAAAVRALGRSQVVAVTAVSESLAVEELAAATEFAAGQGVRHLLPRTNELGSAGYRANGRGRCYFCKSEVLDVIGEVAARHGCAHIATGTNADDAVDPFRPGIRAADERGVLAPLRDAGFTKAEVRRTSLAWGLVTWDKPAAPCLASRIAYGVEVTATRLHRIEAAERVVRGLLTAAGLRAGNLRVRDLGDGVRVEVDADLADRVARLTDVTQAVRGAGFPGADVTVAPFRSGGLNLARP